MVSKDELKKMGITALKNIAKELKIPNYTTFKNTPEDKTKLINLIVDKQITPPPQDIPLKPVEVTRQKAEKGAIPPPPLLGARVEVPTGPETKVEKVTVVKKRTYDFTPSTVISDVNVNLIKYKPGEEDVGKDADSDSITPEILLEKLKSDDFMHKIVTTLYNLYIIKDKKYEQLEKKVQKSIDLDIQEMNEMAAVIDRREAEKMFPLIPVNQGLLVKIRKIRKLCQIAIKKYSTISSSLIQFVRINFRDAITNDDIGILSVSGAKRQNIRNQLCKTLFILSKGYRPFMDSFINIVFTGPAGVGKTKLASTVGYVYAKSGILLVGEVIVVSPKDMVGEYVGQTAPKTAGILMKGLESIIFIDEAYQIMPCDNGEIPKGTKSFGPEAITEIVNFLDKYIGLSIMIVAGYEREIQGCFFAANEGLPRRFPIRYNLPPYSVDSLLNIFLNETNRRIGQDIFNTEIANYIYTVMYKLNGIDKDIFKNQAGDMINLVSMFLNVYYGSYKVNWGNEKDNKIIMNTAFNIFLKNKGYQMQIS